MSALGNQKEVDCTYEGTQADSRLSGLFWPGSGVHLEKPMQSFVNALLIYMRIMIYRSVHTSDKASASSFRFFIAVG